MSQPTERVAPPAPRPAEDGGGSGRVPGARMRERLYIDGWGGLTLPLVAFLLLVFVAPLAVIFTRSFTDPDLGFGNYVSFFSSPIYLDVLVNTFVTATLVTAVTLLIGYPYAYLMTLVSPFWRAALLIVVLVPFWTSLLVRSFALVLLLRNTGVINQTLLSWGVIDEPLSLMRNMTGVTIGMVQVLLPFLVLPLYASMRGIDRRLVQAAEGLGARPSLAFWRVFVPLTIPGAAAGLLLVFIQALGFYITPALLGGPGDIMLGELIVQQVSAVLRWGFAAALAAILLVVTLVLLAIVNRFVDLRRHLGLDR